MTEPWIDPTPDRQRREAEQDRQWIEDLHRQKREEREAREREERIRQDPEWRRQENQRRLQGMERLLVEREAEREAERFPRAVNDVAATIRALAKLGPFPHGTAEAAAVGDLIDALHGCLAEPPEESGS